MARGRKMQVASVGAANESTSMRVRRANGGAHGMPTHAPEGVAARHWPCGLMTAPEIPPPDIDCLVLAGDDGALARAPLARVRWLRLSEFPATDLICCDAEGVALHPGDAIVLMRDGTVRWCSPPRGWACRSSSLAAWIADENERRARDRRHARACLESRRIAGGDDSAIVYFEAKLAIPDVRTREI